MVQRKGSYQFHPRWGAILSIDADPQDDRGSSTAYTVSYTVAPGALVDGMKHVVCFDQAPDNAPTLNVNSLGATPLHYFSAGSWRAVPAGLWAANAIFTVYYNSSAGGAYRIAGLPDRTGSIEAFAGSTAPAGSLLCYGPSHQPHCLCRPVCRSQHDLGCGRRVDYVQPA